MNYYSPAWTRRCFGREAADRGAADSLGSTLVAEVLLLSAAAGMMDAVSYLRTGAFTANMTGNTVLLGLALAGPERAKLYLALAALSAFAAGCMIATLTLLRRPRTPQEELRAGTALELPFAIAFAVASVLLPGMREIAVKMVLLNTAACALGIQSIAVRRLKISGVVTTFLTGTITTTIVSLLAKTEPGGGERNKRPLLLCGMLLCYLLAAIAGGGLAYAHPVLAAAIPVTAIAVVHGISYLA